MLLFLNVLYLSGAADDFDKVEDTAEQLGQLSNEGKSDLELLLIDRLAHEFGVVETPGLSFQSPNDRKFT